VNDTSKPKTPKPAAADPRQVRLAAALKRNLGRRKAAQKAEKTKD
jgi:hypothetical protein